MRVAVVGASGNAGTALLRALRDEEQIAHLLGISRRLPTARNGADEPLPAASVYDGVEWHRFDIGAPVVDARAENLLVEHLATVLTGIDAVVHLAWQVQPNRHRDVLRRTNVAGTWRVVRACLQAEVPRLVVASSVGAYSPANGDEPRDETWPAGGIAGSHYSVDKADQERILDGAEQQGLSVARLRPALIFDADAGAEVLRLFVGGALPPGMLRPGVLPALPVPAGLRMQVVHGDDVADAYRRVLLTGARGAFNIAAEGVLTASDLARIIDHGRAVELPPGVVRRGVALGWKAGLIAADPGWVDMAMGVPVMDTAKAHRELGWSATRSPQETLTELLTAIARGEGYMGAKLRPRRNLLDQLPDGSAIGRRVRGWAGKRLPEDLDTRKLGVYLADHIAGATAGLGQMRLLANQCARSAQLARTHATLTHLADQLEEERALLGHLMDSWELPRRRWRAAISAVSHRVAATGERMSTRVSLSGSSPALGVLDVELLRGAVAAKVGGWQSLADLAPALGMPRSVFAYMEQRARRQLATLEEIHAQLRAREFSLG